ncbi:L-lysine 6-monooxygenase (NADPH-requiring)-domain-containing protein [Limtongia smithiae]|uniref:L-lysine 6-monooxygenase (NADPH-requiring)-domain-containing protein n=1 Tax=Limtongia smithiae TaxID=1125753 RepID=UPI0034CEF74B
MEFPPVQCCDSPASSSAMSAETSASSLDATDASAPDGPGSTAPYDAICIGFGPAGLAIAVALADAVEARRTSTGVTVHMPRVLFLEQQRAFAWHAGMMLPGARMQVSFVKDFATLRNPRSQFTFLNYLRVQGRLLDFVNQATFYPLREEYQGYMRWCATQIDPATVRYGERGEEVRFDGEEQGMFTVISVCDSGARVVRRARNVIICVGGRPRMPTCLPAPSRLARIAQPTPPESLQFPQIIHSSQIRDFLDTIRLLSQSVAPPLRRLRVAVLGAGQSAAEIASHLHDILPRGARVDMIFPTRALRPSDDSPFVNEIFNPEAVDEVFALDPVSRAKVIADDRGTNYAVVRMQLIEHLYALLYAQKLHSSSGSQENDDAIRLRMMPCRKLVGAQEDIARDVVKLVLLDTERDVILHDEQPEYHVLIAATGYDRTSACAKLLQPLQKYMPNGRVEVDRWYQLRLDISPKVWIQGACEETHGLSDSLLSIMAVRGQQIVERVFPFTSEQCPRGM